MSEPKPTDLCPVLEPNMIEDQGDVPAMNPWWQPPRLRIQDEKGHERHATWMELFFDLILVAAIGQLGKALLHNLTPQGFFQFVVLAIPIWWAWTGIAFYSSRFDTNDLSDRIFYFLQMVGVAAMAINVQEGLGASSVPFALSYVFMRFLLVLQYLLAGKFVPEARPLTYRYALGFGLAAACFLASVWVAIPQRFLLWGLGLMLDVGVPLTAGQMHSKLPPHTSHISERYGLFIIVVLGETVMGAVAGISSLPVWTVPAAFSGILGLLIAFSLWWLYFDHASKAPVRAARDEGRIWLYQAWLYAHLPLMLSLSALGVAVQSLVLSAQYDVTPPTVKWLLCLSTAVSLLATGVIHVTSCYMGSRLVVKIWLPYLLAVGTILVLALLLPYGLRPYAWSLLITGICISHLVVHVFYDRHSDYGRKARL